MGLSGLFGFGRGVKKAVEPQLSAPAPTTAGTLITPPDVIKQASQAQIAAKQAATRTRKRAAAGSLSSTAQPTGTILASTAQPKTLLGY